MMYGGQLPKSKAHVARFPVRNAITGAVALFEVYNTITITITMHPAPDPGPGFGSPLFRGDPREHPHLSHDPRIRVYTEVPE